MSDVMLVYTLFPNASEAADACRILLTEKLIACANRLSPVISHYEWEGEMQAEEEFPVIFKTSAGKADTVRQRIAELHSYDLPAILAWNAKADTPFASWVTEEIA